jgi:hypothetical protein
MPSVWRNAVTDGTATNLTQINTTSSYTVSFWAKFTGTGDIMRHASTANAARDGYGFSFSTGELLVRHFTGTGSTNYIASSGGLLLSPTWQHYAVIYSGGVLLTFINGEFRNRTVAANAPTANAACTTTLTPNLTGTFNGNLFDFQMLPNVAVPVSDVITLMDPRYRHPGVRARWFGLQFPGTGPSSTLRDESGNNSNLTTSATGRLFPDVEPPYLPTLA